MLSKLNWTLLVFWELIIVVAILVALWPFVTSIFKQNQKNNSKQFTNVYDTSGIDKMAFARGVSWIDFNNDGFDDLVLVGGVDGTRLYSNLEGKFSYVASESIQSYKREIGSIFADFNNDGCSDVFVSGGQSAVMKLLKGNCRGGFNDITEKAGIDDGLIGSRGASWADYDNDGKLDLYVAFHGIIEGSSYQYRPNILYRNNGDETFSDVTIKAAVNGIAKCNLPAQKQTIETFFGYEINEPLKESFQPAWFDYNNDNLIDLFVATDYGVSPLYRNNGDGTFTDVTFEAHMCLNGTNMGVAVGDYNNDGFTDLFTTNVGRHYFWKNNGDGTFTEGARRVGISDEKSIGWGTGLLDYDNDGRLDLYVVNGYVRIVGEEDYQNNIGIKSEDKLYRNLGDEKFKEISGSAGISGDDTKLAAAFSDYNKDGFVDIFVVSYPSNDNPIYRLYKNKGNDNNWIAIKLKGKISNKDSIGAKIKVFTNGKMQQRQVEAGSSYISQNSLWQTIGIGKAKKIDRVEIIWPSGKTKTMFNLKSKQHIVISEPN